MQYAELKHTDVAAHRHKPVIVPIGSLEQHGEHLPLLTDTMINMEICRRADHELGDEALFLPILYAGASDHHLRFAGTISFSLSTYTQMLEDIVESLINSGFRRIVLFNSHGGNGTPGTAALYNVQMRHRDMRDLWLTMATWFGMAAPQIAQIKELESQDHVTHSCELETSMVLRIRPDTVRMSAARGANFEFESEFYSPDSSKSSRVTVMRSFEQVTRTGALGHPEVSTAEKGERLYEVVTREFVKFVREFAGWKTFEPG